MYDFELIAKDEVFKIAYSNGIEFSNYLISNYGRLYSFNHNRILNVRIDMKGYTRYRLYKDGKCHYIPGHRLVAFAFVENPRPNEYNTVNPLNNLWTNLQWCNDKINLNHGTAQYRRMIQRCKPVAQCSLDGETVAKYISRNDTSRQTGFSISIVYNSCHDGKPREGYYWNYIN